VLDLVAAERRSGRVALPVTTTRIAEEVCSFHGVEVGWTPTSPHGLYEATAADDVIFAADGRGGFVVPEFSRSIDGIAAFARLTGLVARTRLTLSQIHARIPVAHLLKRSVPTPWAEGSVMRTIVEAAGERRSIPRMASGSSKLMVAGRSRCPIQRTRSRTCGPGC
jgi:mannose-1-phosphate guanylyltransferase/phosphomannomutase